ncbi:MAG: hypothetical protein OEV24_21875 [Cyclobacteriaceae bacterium]|jgi:hypothetical protein|nr:hypothetical protein [Cyclobacteriaceae bacterium]
MRKSKRQIWFYALMSLCVLGSGACDGVRSKLSANGKNYDSLFLGISLGMEKQAFYDHCWELNRLKVFSQGPKNQEVQYMLKNELDAPVYMRFYPNFYRDKIVDMPVLFSYEAWAPWNKQYSADTLFVNILPLFKKWYGDDFKLLEHPTMGKVYYKFDGKRRINLFIRDDQVVQAVFTDMELANERKRNGDNEGSVN